MIRLVLPREIAENWSKYRALLLKAIEHDDKRDPADVLTDLLSGDFALLEVNENPVNLVAVIELAEIDGKKCLFLAYLAGTVGPYPPKQWITRIRALAAQHLGEIAKAMHCTEIRIEGRDWARVFPDWECVNPARHELRKVLG